MNPIFRIYNRQRFKGMSVKEASKLSDEEKILYIIDRLDIALKKYQKEKIRSELVGQN